MEIINNKTSERTVKTIANNILPSCDELFFEVGYFYFFFFFQIYEQLKNKKINVNDMNELVHKLSTELYLEDLLDKKPENKGTPDIAKVATTMVQ